MITTSLLKKARNIAEACNGEIEILHYFKADSIRIKLNDFDMYSRSLTASLRIKDVYIYSNPYCYTVEIMSLSDYSAKKESDKKRDMLIDRFFAIIRETQDQEKAKTAEYKLALEIGAIDEFNYIYR